MTVLAEYARVPTRFAVDRVLDVVPRLDDPARFTVSERRVDVPYEKDYDAIAGAAPLQWARRFDLSNWGFIAARVATRIVGAAAVAFDTPGFTTREERRDLVVLWDIRVSPEIRGTGVGSALLERAERWAQSRGCRQLAIETQNTNVRACRFYERYGYQLRAVNRAAYPKFPEEIQLLWYKDLPR